MMGLGRPTSPWEPSAPRPIPDPEAPPSESGMVATPGRTCTSEVGSFVVFISVVLGRVSSLIAGQTYSRRLLGGHPHDTSARKRSRSHTPGRGEVPPDSSGAHPDASRASSPTTHRVHTTHSTSRGYTPCCACPGVLRMLPAHASYVSSLGEGKPEGSSSGWSRDRP